MNNLPKFSRQQYLQFVEDYYHTRYKGDSLLHAFYKAFTQIDDPTLEVLVDEEHILNHIERHYVEPEQLVT